MTIIITHTPAEGTLIEGSRKGDGVYEILFGLRRARQGNWRYFRSLGQIGLGQSRDKPADTWAINKAAEALRADGFEVAIEVDDERTRPFAEAEQDRYDRAEARAWHHKEQAGKTAGEADARWRSERKILDGIPMGQPILVGHHSEGRHRRDLARADNHMRKALEAANRRDYHVGRAGAAESYEAGRKSLGTTLRRIDKLEASRRRLLRYHDGTGNEMHGRHEPAAGERRERLDGEIAALDEQIAYWRKHVADLEAAGVKVWTRADFSKGDYACGPHGWYEVLRVNRVSVTVPDPFCLIGLARVFSKAEADRVSRENHWGRTRTKTLPYDEITGRKTASEIAAIPEEPTRTQQEGAKESG